jgi:hypothetical protein
VFFLFAPCAFLLCVDAAGILLYTLSWVSLYPNHMAPTNKKCAASVPPGSDAKQPANKKGARKTSSNAKTSWLPSTKQSSLGFSSSKHPQYQVGTKLLLDTGVYNDDVPEKVINHMFVCKIVELNQNGTTVKIEYKNQVILEGGNKFCQYKDSKETQVSLFLLGFACIIPFHQMHKHYCCSVLLFLPTSILI